MMSQDMEPSLQRLAEALAQERRAIIEHDVEALMQSTQEKLASLQALESQVSDPASPPLQQRLHELSLLNQANGVLLARRRREVNWALHHLGRSESSGAYDALGQIHHVCGGRRLAVV